MLNDDGLSIVQVKKSDLLHTLKRNREVHSKLALEAADGYRADAILALTKMLADAKEGGPIKRNLDLVQPQDHTADYDRVIRMLEMSISDTVTVTESQFAQYVEDEWAWKRGFVESAGMYSGKR